MSDRTRNDPDAIIRYAERQHTAPTPVEEMAAYYRRCNELQPGSVSQMSGSSTAPDMADGLRTLSVSRPRPSLKTAMALLVAVLIAAGSFLYRFNTLGGRLAGFDNDHFIQLVRSTAVLDGERPIRDFTDTALEALWPAPTYSASAMAQQAFGPSLRSEALFTVGMLSLGAAVLFWVSWTFSGAIIPAALLAVLAVALRPALYNYSKIVPFVLAVAMMLAYARRPTMTRLSALAATLALAALYRHDYGVYVGVATATLVLLMHGRPGGQRRLLVLSGICFALLLPGIAFAQMHGGFITYLRQCLEISRQEAARTAETGAHFTIDWSQSLLIHRAPPPPPNARFAIRWVTTLTPQMRQRAESELQLLEPIRRQDDWNWSYAISAPSPDRLSAIVHDSRVLDTDGIDRSTFAIVVPPAPDAPGWTDEWSRWRLAPGILTRDNAAPWLYYVAWAIVIFAMVCALWPPLFERPPATVPRPAVLAACVLGLLMLIGFLRSANPSRLADVSVPVTILGAWLLSVITRGLQSFARPVRYAVAMCLAGLLCVSTAAIVVMGDVGHQLSIAGLTSVDDVRDRLSVVSSDLAGLPSTLNGIDEDLRRTSSYLRRCTSPTDRLLVADNLSEIYYFAERRFAAGQNSFFSNFYSSPTFQRTAIERWDNQSVPIALTQSGRRFEQEFSSDYPLLTDYLRTHYRRAGSLRAEAGNVMDVWIDARHRFAADPETGLPCAQAQRADLQPAKPSPIQSR